MERYSLRGTVERKKKYWKLVILEKIAWHNTDDQSKKSEIELVEKEDTREIENG